MSKSVGWSYVPPASTLRMHSSCKLRHASECFCLAVAVSPNTLDNHCGRCLQLAGLSVAVVERGELAGRAQEWNISRKEIAELVRCSRTRVMLAGCAAGGMVGHQPKCLIDQVSTGVMTKAEAEEIISIEFNPIRCGFDGSPDVWVEDVLNLGVSPLIAIQLVTYHILLVRMLCNVGLAEAQLDHVPASRVPATATALGEPFSVCFTMDTCCM